MIVHVVHNTDFAGGGGMRGQEGGMNHISFYLYFIHVLKGSISPKNLRAACTHLSHKSVRIQSSCLYLFTLLGSMGAKAALRMLMKLTPGC